MGDLFHKDVPEHDIHRVLGIIAMCQEHDFLILTKRPERMAKVFANIKSSILRKSLEFLAKSGWPMKNLWLGVTAENQEQADIRIPKLLEIPAALHWASIEPMLGPVDFRKWLGLDCPQCGGCDIRADHDPACTTRWCDDCGYEDNRAKLGWIVCGGESGPGARPMHPDWPRKLRDDCKAAGVPFFFKQWGEWAHRSYVIAGAHSYAKINKTRLLALDDCTLMERVGKKAAGRLLDGKEHSEYPEGVSDA
jgi:protein gp37